MKRRYYVKIKFKGKESRELGFFDESEDAHEAVKRIVREKLEPIESYLVLFLDVKE